MKVGASYLAHMKDLFGDLKIALTAYNAGPTWVSKMIAAKQTLPLQYATKVLSTQRSLENCFARHGISSMEASGERATLRVDELQSCEVKLLRFRQQNPFK